MPIIYKAAARAAKAERTTTEQKNHSLSTDHTRRIDELDLLLESILLR